MEQRNLIIDCDPGHDDAIAILMALAHPEQFNILGITTVGGNQLLDRVTKNALKVLSLVEKNIPVASGEAYPLTREIHTGGDAHGESGMDGPLLPEPLYGVVSDKGVNFMYDLIMKSEKKVTILAIGPLTNIALLLRAYPKIEEKIEEIVIMGGGIYTGNRSAAAEFNIYVDPEAAKMVFASSIPLVMAGLDVTNTAMIMDDEIPQLHTGGKVATFVAELLEFYGIASKRFGFEGSALHDPCAMGYLLRPDLFSGKDYHVDVETQGELTRGMTLADIRPVPEKEANTHVLLEVKRKEFISYVIECIEILDREIREGL